MATLTNLRDRLKKRTSLTQNDKLSDQDLDAMLQDAVLEHNNDYTIATIPKIEEDLVLILANVSICFYRANRNAQESPLATVNGVSQSADSPFARNMKLIDSLRKEYNAKRANIGADGLGETDGQVQVSEFTTTSGQSGLLEPYAPPPNPATLRFEPVPGTTEIILSWSFPYYDNFEYAALYYSLDANIHEPWNLRQNGDISGISSSAVLVATMYDQDKKALRAIGPFDSDVPYHFVLVIKSKNAKCAFSNEVVYTP